MKLLRREPRHLTRTLGAAVATAIVFASCSTAVDEPADIGTPLETPLALPADASPIVAAAHDCLENGATHELLPPDDDTILRTLENGLTYYVRSNDAPAGHLDLRLVVRAGGAHDPVGAEGTAHFVEHMLFNGTESFPRNELNEALRDIGLELGPDENAYTTYDSTVYFMSITTSGTEHLIDKLDVPFEILSEWATSATILPDDVNAERGIVRNELDLRAGSAEGHVRQAIEDLMFIGTPYEAGRIGGTHASLSAITPGHLLDFYATSYVPQNMAVIAVGDLDESELQDLVERHFQRLPSGPPVPASQRWPASIAQVPQFTHAVHADVGVPYVSINWQTPAWRRGTACGERFRIFDQIIHRMLDARMSRAHETGTLSQANAPGVDLMNPAARVQYYTADVQGSDLARSTADFWSVVRGTEMHPFTRAELERAEASVRAGIERETEGVTWRHDSSYAADFTDHFVRGADLRAAADRLSSATEVLDSISAAELNDYHRWVMSRVAPIVVAAGSDEANLPPIGELESAIGAVAPAAPLPVDETATAFMDAPNPVPQTGSQTIDIDAYGGTTVRQWTFANGARVVFDDVGYGGDSVHVMIESLGGTSLLDPADAGLAAFALQAVAASGLGDLSAFQVADLVEQSGITLTPFVEHTTEGFLGQVEDSGLEALFAYVHLLLTEPRVSEGAARAAQQNARNAAAEAESSAVRAAQAAYATARFGDSEYFWPLPAADQIDTMTADKLLALYTDRFVGVDDLTLAIVGDVPSDDVADLAARYIGSLPARPADVGVDRRPPRPPGVRRIEVHADTAAESGLDFYFELPRSVSPELVATADVLAATLNEHLVQRVREDLGQTYAVQVFVVPLYEPEPRLWSYISASGPGDALPDIERRIHETIEHVSTAGPSASDLEQAISIVTNDAHFGGRLWRPFLLQMRRVVGDENLPTASRIERAAANVTASDVRDLARALFGSGQRIEIVRAPPPEN